MELRPLHDGFQWLETGRLIVSFGNRSVQCERNVECRLF